MLRQYEYIGSISSVTLPKCDEIKLYNPDNREISPTLVDGSFLQAYINEVEFCDDEERYLPHKFVYDSNLILNEIHILNKDGKDAKIIVGGLGKHGNIYFHIFGPQDTIKTDEPEMISADENHKYWAWKHEMI